MAAFDIKTSLGEGRDVVDSIDSASLGAALGADLSSICLSGKSFTRSAAAELKPLLSKLASLEDLDMSDVIASRPEEEGLEVLTLLSEGLTPSKGTLKRIDLSDNALGEKGVRACFPLLGEAEALRELLLCNNGLSAEACDVLRDTLLFRGEDVESPLSLFHFHDNMCGDAGGVALSKLLARLPHLEDLRFSKTRCGREGCAAMAAALPSCPKLHSINFEDTTFGNTGAAVLAEAFGSCPLLRTVNLRDTMLEEDGADLVLEALSEHAPALEVLDISGNDLTFSNAPTLVSCLREKTELRALSLDDNELGAAGALEVAKGLAAPNSFPALRSLSMKACDLSSSSAKLLVRAALLHGGVEQLLLDENFIEESALGEIEAALAAAGRTMAFLGDLEGNNDDEEDEDDEDIAAVRAFDLGALRPKASADVDEVSGLLDASKI